MLGSVISLPCSSNRASSTPGAGRPHEPGFRIWSAGARMVSTPSSVEPYTSQSESAGKSATYCFLRAKDQGAAFAIITRMLVRSYLAFTSSGRLQIMRIGVGAENVEVALYL